MFCSNCGNKSPAGARFCNKCGAKMVDYDVTTPQADIPAPHITDIDHTGYPQYSAPQAAPEPQPAPSFSEPVIGADYDDYTFYPALPDAQSKEESDNQANENSYFIEYPIKKAAPKPAEPKPPVSSPAYTDYTPPQPAPVTPPPTPPPPPVVPTPVEPKPQYQDYSNYSEYTSPPVAERPVEPAPQYPDYSNIPVYTPPPPPSLAAPRPAAPTPQPINYTDFSDFTPPPPPPVSARAIGPELLFMDDPAQPEYVQPLPVYTPPPAYTPPPYTPPPVAPRPATAAHNIADEPDYLDFVTQPKPAPQNPNTPEVVHLNASDFVDMAPQPAPPPPPNPMSQHMEYMDYNTGAPHRPNQVVSHQYPSKKRGWIIAVFAIIAVIAAGAVFYVFFFSGVRSEQLVGVWEPADQTVGTWVRLLEFNEDGTGRVYEFHEEHNVIRNEIPFIWNIESRNRINNTLWPELAVVSISERDGVRIFRYRLESDNTWNEYQQVAASG